MVCIKSYYYNYRLITSCLEFIKLSVRALRCASISSNTLQLYLMQNSFTNCACENCLILFTFL